MSRCLWRTNAPRVAGLGQRVTAPNVALKCLFDSLLCERAELREQIHGGDLYNALHRMELIKKSPINIMVR